MPVTGPRLHLAPDPNAASQGAWRLFRRLSADFAAVLPEGAEIEHVGATAVPGCQTKGDLDIAIRVPREVFPACLAELGRRYAVNPGSVRTADFAAFCDDAADPPVGIQLVVVGSQLDVFTRFRDRLRAEPCLVARYNALKRACAGREMEAYRTAKARFIESVLAEPPAGAAES